MKKSENKTFDKAVYLKTEDIKIPGLNTTPIDYNLTINKP